jgi:surface antigen
VQFKNSDGVFAITSTVSSTDSTVFDSTDGARGIFHHTSSTNTSLMNQVTDGDDWIKIQPGKNPFQVKTTPGIQAVTVTYTAKFGGI